MREMTSERAEWIRQRLGLNHSQITEGLNRLAGTNYGRSDASRWFKSGGRGPSVTLALYLRLALKEAWHQRRSLRERDTLPLDSLKDRVGRLVDLADAELERTDIVTDAGAVELEPGMAVTADVKTGRRRVISYLLSPFAHQIEEAGRER
jgi:hypothetical protein